MTNASAANDLSMRTSTTTKTTVSTISRKLSVGAAFAESACDAKTATCGRGALMKARATYREPNAMIALDPTTADVFQPRNVRTNATTNPMAIASPKRLAQRIASSAREGAPVSRARDLPPASGRGARAGNSLLPEEEEDPWEKGGIR